MTIWQLRSRFKTYLTTNVLWKKILFLFYIRVSKKSFAFMSHAQERIILTDCCIFLSRKEQYEDDVNQVYADSIRRHESLCNYEWLLNDVSNYNKIFVFQAKAHSLISGRTFFLVYYSSLFEGFYHGPSFALI